MQNENEILLKENKDRFVILPIKHGELSGKLEDFVAKHSVF